MLAGAKTNIEESILILPKSNSTSRVFLRLHKGKKDKTNEGQENEATDSRSS